MKHEADKILHVLHSSSCHAIRRFILPNSWDEREVASDMSVKYVTLDMSAKSVRYEHTAVICVTSVLIFNRSNLNICWNKHHNVSHDVMLG